MRGFARSLERLGLDYLDMYVIHQPYHDYFGAWRALEELYKQGKIRAISIDNFTQDRLADFMFWNKIKPASNLLECNPYFQRPDEQAYLERENILMQAWSPLAAGQEGILNHPTICAIANSHRKSPAQVVLHWLVQRNILPLVKTSNPQRMKENLNIFDFTLTDAEMQDIAKLDRGHTCFMPRNTGKSVHDFLTQAVAGTAPSGIIEDATK